MPCPPPSPALRLKDVKVNGHCVTYVGEHAMSFRVDGKGRLTAFAGNGASRITIDGHTTVFAKGKFADVAWAPLPGNRRVKRGALMQIVAHGNGTLRIPTVNLPDAVAVFAEGATPGSKGVRVEAHRAKDTLVVTIPKELSGRSFYVVVE